MTGIIVTNYPETLEDFDCDKCGEFMDEVFYVDDQFICGECFE